MVTFNMGVFACLGGGEVVVILGVLCEKLEKSLELVKYFNSFKGSISEV